MDGNGGYVSRQEAHQLSNSTYSGGPYGAARPQPRASPPGSQHPSGSTDMSRPSAASSGGRPPSSASSLARSSYGRASGSVMGGPPVPSHGMRRLDAEEMLQRHYTTLRSYLAASLQDESGAVKTNRARDKLLRLSPTQFMELSTDVFDELVRREDERLQRVANVPRFLPPKSNFHPKRNQARQKLSTLPLDRFRQLASDVFYELERRIPRIAAGELDRPGSAASSQSRGGMRAGPGHRPGPGGRNFSPYGYGPASPGLPPGARPPQPKTFQSSTMIPNKSTMVEDDDGYDDEEDAFGLDRVMSGLAERNTISSNGEDRKRIEEQELEIAELRRKVENLESANSDHGDWTNLRDQLEQKSQDAQRLNDDLQRELEQLRRDKEHDEQNIRAQLDNMHSQADDLRTQLQTFQEENQELRGQLESGQQQSASQGDNERRIKLLETELAMQERLTSEVRDEVMNYLREMKDLSKQNDRAVEREERLSTQVSKLERDIDEWRQRYARVKAHNKSIRASAMGLDLQNSFDVDNLFRHGPLVSQNGLVKDVDVTRFQLSIDELLQVARQPATQPMLDNVRNVVICVQSITSSIGTDGYPTPVPSPQDPTAAESPSVGKLRARVTVTANNLITATKQHSSAGGLSPVALLDAAASNLSAAVVELIKAVGIRPSPRSELQDNFLDLAPDSAASRTNHTSVSSFYDDSVSPPDPDTYSFTSSLADGATAFPHPRQAVQVHVQAPASATAVAVASGSLSSASSLTEPGEITTSSAEKPKPAPLNLGSLGRSNTMKKWFGWGRGADELDTLATPIADTPQTSSAAAAHGLQDEDDYEEFS